MVNDPQRYRYPDASTGHQVPPAGLKPTVSTEKAPATPVASVPTPEAKPIPVLNEEQKKRRLVLLDQMTQQVADVVPNSPGTENLEKPKLESVLPLSTKSQHQNINIQRLNGIVRESTSL